MQYLFQRFVVLTLGNESIVVAQKIRSLENTVKLKFWLIGRFRRDGYWNIKEKNILVR